jgi:hypothetical protein
MALAHVLGRNYKILTAFPQLATFLQLDNFEMIEKDD